MQDTCLIAEHTVITIAATILEISVGIATPAVPIRNPNTRIAFPVTLIAFIKSDTRIDTCEFPIARKIAAPPLYNAINGIEAVTISR